MRLSEKLNIALNYQCEHEKLNYEKYIIMASYFDRLQLINLYNYFFKQAQDELEHFNKIVKHINDRLGGRYIPQNTEIDLEITSIEQLADIYVKTEVETTESLEAIYELICEEKSFIDKPLLMWLLAEQVEEENSADKFQKRVSYTKDLLILDHVYEGG